MSRVFSWKSVAVGVGLVLATAVACFVGGNPGMGSALIVVAIVEGAIHAAVVGLISLGNQRQIARTG